MKLELAIVLSCQPEGCNVRLVGQSSPLETVYAAPVYNQIRVRRGDLVAVDLASVPPELVWRWRRVEVLRPLTRQPAKGHVFAGSAGSAFEARIAQPDLQLQPGDHIWVMGHEGGMEIAARDVDGEPEHPEWIRRTYFPIIEAHYESLQASS